MPPIQTSSFRTKTALMLRGTRCPRPLTAEHSLQLSGLTICSRCDVWSYDFCGFAGSSETLGCHLVLRCAVGSAIGYDGRTTRPVFALTGLRRNFTATR